MNKTYNCQICGGMFKSYNKTPKYCSSKCQGIGLTIKTNIDVECKNCSKHFFVKKTILNRGKGKFCCKNCYTEHSNKLNIGSIINGYCKICGKGFHFTPYLIQTNKQFCSNQCFSKSLEKKITKNCINCNSLFTDLPHSNQKHCSRKCFETKYLIEYKCENCGVSFNANKKIRNPIKSHHFCSNKCKFSWCKGKPHPKMSEWMAINIANGNFEPFAGNYYTQGYYISKITNNTEYYASSYELKRMEQLDKLGVKWTKKHNIKIKYLDKNNTEHYFIPNLLVNNTIVEEIKPINLLNNNNNQEKFLAAEKYCKNNDLIFKVLTEKELGIKI